ncbi:MAG: glycosyltransferase family 4 protein [Bacteroidetes bacterium]|nr:glycosyltransferase family 4 protein [Bacteroidota bacterium]
MLQPKTVLFLTAWYPTNEQPSHGIFVKNHAIALSNYCNVVVIYAHSSIHSNNKLIKNQVSESFTEYILAYPKSKYNIPLFSSIIKLYRYKKAYKTLYTQICHHKFDSIQANIAFPTALVTNYFQKKLKLQVVLLEHWTGYLKEDGRYKGFINKFFTKKIVSQSKQILCVSEALVSAMKAHKLNGNYKLVYNVVDTAVFNLEGKHQANIFRLIHVSSLDPLQKNLGSILHVIKTIQMYMPVTLTVIGGTNQLIDQYKNLCIQNNISEVLFLGNLSPVRLAEELKKSSALILFSRFENLPVVVLEAMACGLPIISSKVGMLEKLIVPETGILIPINDNAELEKVLSSFLKGNITFNATRAFNIINESASITVVGKALYETHF